MLDSLVSKPGDAPSISSSLEMSDTLKCQSEVSSFTTLVESCTLLSPFVAVSGGLESSSLLDASSISSSLDTCITSISQCGVSSSTACHLLPSSAALASPVSIIQSASSSDISTSKQSSPFTLVTGVPQLLGVSTSHSGNSTSESSTSDGVETLAVPSSTDEVDALS